MKKVVAASNWTIVHGKEQLINLYGEAQPHRIKEFGHILHPKKWMKLLKEVSSI